MRSLGIPGPFKFPRIPNVGPGVSGFGWARMRSSAAPNFGGQATVAQGGLAPSKKQDTHYVSPAAARDAGARPRRIDMDPPLSSPDVRLLPIDGVASSNRAFVKRSSPGV